MNNHCFSWQLNIVHHIEDKVYYKRLFGRLFVCLKAILRYGDFAKGRLVGDYFLETSPHELFPAPHANKA